MFRLGRKTKSTSSAAAAGNGKGPSNKDATYVHPLAGQQDVLRKQMSSQPEAGPSHLSVEPERDPETLSITKGWFGSSSVGDDDDDDESVGNSPSLTGTDFESRNMLFESVQQAFEKEQLVQQKGGANVSASDSKGSFAKSRSADQSPEKKQADLIQMAQKRQVAMSAAREGGILNRIKRISKKEKSNAVEENDGEGSGSSLASTSSVEPTTPLDIEAYRSDSDQFSDTTSDTPIPKVREAAKEMVPLLRTPHRERMHSVQPSLIDQESLIGSRSHSPLISDEDDLEERLTRGRSEVDDVASQYGDIGYISEDREEEEEKAGASWQLEAGPDPSFVSFVSEAGSVYQDTWSASGSDYGFTSPAIDTASPRPPSVAFHDRTPSEYAQALSRQPSMYAYSERNSYQQQQLSEEQEEQEDDEVLYEDETPKAAIEAGRSSYFAAPTVTALPSATASNFTASTPTREAPPLRKTFSWFKKAALSPQQRYSFLRHVFARELIWEFERLFMLSDAEVLFQSSPNSMLPRTDLAYFKPEAEGATPNVPLIRLLYTHVFSTCPIFGPAQPIEGAAAMRARKLGAKRFFDAALLPLLRFQHRASLGSAVDINGEWPREMFDSPSTMGIILGSTFKVATKLIMGKVSDRSCHPWDWSDVAPPSPSAYLSHRTPPSKLQQGGMEVNIVGARTISAQKDCELLLSVKRFGFPPQLIVRNESDFYEYALGLAEELKRHSRIRPVPPPAGQDRTSQLPQLPSEETLNVGDMSLSSSINLARKLASQDQLYTRRNSSQSSLQSLSTPTRPKPFRLASSDSAEKFGRKNASSVSIDSLYAHPLEKEQQQQQQQPKPFSPQIAQAESPRSTMTEKSKFFLRGNKNTTSVGEGNDSQVNLSASAGSTIGAGVSSNPLASDDEARRKQLRAWLRDALSVRGAGHASETKAFLSNGSFLEKEVRSATKKDIQRRMMLDGQAMRERGDSAAFAHEEVLELRREMKNLWRDCIEGDGLLQMYEALKRHETFSGLPLPYQRVISWTNFKVAQFLHHTFLTSHESRSNFGKMTELMQSIPWKALSLALREPTGLMIQKVRSSFTQEFVLKKILALYLEDVPAKKLELEIAALQKRLGSTIVKKLQGFVTSAEWQKKMIRKTAKQNNIPLVAAIVRGSNRPLLAAEGIKRIVTATKTYQEFLSTSPTFEEHRAKQRANVEVRLICDMQRVLRLLTLRSDGSKIRAALAKELRAPIEALLEPFFSLLKRLHRLKLFAHTPIATWQRGTEGGGKDVMQRLQEFIFKLMDVIAGLQMRVQDPWRSLHTLTLFLDDFIPTWFQSLHRFANADVLLLDCTVWLKNILTAFLSVNSTNTSTSKAAPNITMEELARFWQPPKDELNSSDLKVIDELTSIAKRKRSFQLEAACRWAAGDTDADHSIQLMGQGGKTRLTPFSLPPLPAVSPPTQVALQSYLNGLRSSLDSFM
ncbi:hypothetical protein CBS101457_004802 [Exobasidium rhododendri]|nr:hypothetical protein CBS101457_004802 [Exobasidium rhododendri]